MEHRWGERTRVDIPTRIATRHSVLIGAGRFSNLSASGGFIAGSFSVRLLSQVQVSVVSAGAQHEAVLLPAYVARKCSSGVGVEWCDFAPMAVTELLRAAATGARLRFVPAESAPSSASAPAPTPIPSPLNAR
jgi:hypothetical protein